MIIHLHDKRRQAADWASKIQHLIGGVPLLLSGVHNFAEPAERPMAVAEIAVAVIVLAAFLKELRTELRGHHGNSHSPVGWFDLAAGGLLIFEAFHGAVHKPGYLRPQFLSGIATLGIGLFHARLHELKSRKRYLQVDESGVEFRLSRFRHLRMRWENLSSINLKGPCATFRRADGKLHKVRLNLLHDADAIRRAISEHARAAGVPTE